jgi:transposase
MDSAGAKDQAVGRSRGGLTTKIHTIAYAQGRPLRFLLTGGEAHDSTTAAELLAGRITTGVIADKAYDNNALRDLIGKAGAEAVIPSLSSRKLLIPHDAVAYKLRNAGEGPCRVQLELYAPNFSWKKSRIAAQQRLSVFSL